MPASCAARATFTSGTAAPVRTLAVDGDFVEAAAKPNDDAVHAAVAHEQIGAEPDHRHRDFGRKNLQENRRGLPRPLA